jgi:D-glycero-alpha-D-manno-heptose 1-phosphate guanylyltransferase
MKMDTLANITAAILAGGLGTRLRSVVPDRPKVLAEVQGRPFLTYVFENLASQGVREVVLCTGYLGEQIRAAFGETWGPLRLWYSQEETPLGTGGALRLALPLIQSDSVLVLNGDSFCPVSLAHVRRSHQARGARLTLVLAQVPDAGRFGRVEVHPNGLVREFAEKDATGSPGWINAGIYFIDRALLRMIPAWGAVSLEREMFPAWKRWGIYGYRAKARFLDMGVPEAYQTAGEFFTRGNSL